MPIYYHPFRFLDNAEEARPPVDWEGVEKRLLGQYRYYGKNVLKFDGTRLSRQEVINLINDAELNEKHHRKLLIMEKLLAFVERGELDFFKKNKEWVAFSDEDFVEWLKPYFTTKYNQLLKKAIEQSNLVFAWTMDSSFPLPPSYYEGCFKDINEMVKEKAEALNRIASRNDYLNRPFQMLSVDSRRINQYFKASYGILLSKLPLEMVPAITQYAQAIQKIHDGIMKAADNDVMNINVAQLILTEAIADCAFTLNNPSDKTPYYDLKAAYHLARKADRPETKAKMDDYFSELDKQQRKGYFVTALIIIILMVISMILLVLVL